MHFHNPKPNDKIITIKLFKFHHENGSTPSINIILKPGLDYLVFISHFEYGFVFAINVKQDFMLHNCSFSKERALFCTFCVSNNSIARKAELKPAKSIIMCICRFTFVKILM